MKKQLFRSEFVRNASVLSFGSLIAQLVPFLVYPLIGRLYTPTQAAILASFTSVVSIIQVASTGKYEGAILLAKDHFEAANVAVLSMLICACVCLGVGIPLLLFPDYFSLSALSHRASTTILTLSWCHVTERDSSAPSARQ